MVFALALVLVNETSKRALSLICRDDGDVVTDNWICAARNPHVAMLIRTIPESLFMRCTAFEILVLPVMVECITLPGCWDNHQEFGPLKRELQVCAASIGSKRFGQCGVIQVTSDFHDERWSGIVVVDAVAIRARSR